MSLETLSKPEVDFTDYALEQVNTELEHASPLEIVQWAYETFGDDLIGATNFRETSPVMLALISKINHDIQVVTVRLGHESEKTKTLARWYEATLGLNLAIHGDDIQIAHGAKAVSDRKAELFQREVVERYKPQAILFGLMRQGETEGRENIPIIERRDSFFAINPVANVTPQDVDEFFRLSSYPRNRNYHDPAKGPDQKSECGLHRPRPKQSISDPSLSSLR
ncbi:MAG: phosphoadenosine phosphosulfate reductase family protein [Candidatus Saccharibacteria bacterium]|nr:phosphoadenosine phosphosulfate reductase family protein [Candidatus Saccharibacteria bacterium]